MKASGSQWAPPGALSAWNIELLRAAPLFLLQEATPSLLSFEPFSGSFESGPGVTQLGCSWMRLDYDVLIF